MERCIKCLEPRYIENAYGEVLCEECWEDYLTTERGLVEYFICLAEGRTKHEYYDADFLGEALISYIKNKQLLKLDKNEATALENYRVTLNKMCNI